MIGRRLSSKLVRLYARDTALPTRWLRHASATSNLACATTPSFATNASARIVVKRENDYDIHNPYSVVQH